jgi:hypothetical protein
VRVTLQHQVDGGARLIHLGSGQGRLAIHRSEARSGEEDVAFAERDLEVLGQAWAPTGHYVDPLSDVTGYDGLADMVDGVRAQFPGATLQRMSEIDAHHNVVKFAWNATGTDGSVIVAGTDVCVLADDGRLSAIAGFFS